MSELSDIDGIFWGKHVVYPLEIKEKTVAHDSKVGDYFGLDLGPFTKLAFYTSIRSGNLYSLFIVKEINDITTRSLIKWWFIPFDKISRFASWVPAKGGRNMQGSESVVVKIPKNEFEELNAQTLGRL